MIDKRRAILFVIFLGLAFRIINLNQSLWLDEAAQAIESMGSFSGLFRIYADFMPPFFHILLFFWMKVSHSEWWMRLLSVTFGVLTIYFTYLCAKNLFSSHIALLSAFLLAINPFHIYYSQELRPYSLAAFLATASTYFLITSQYVRYTIISMLLVYSLYTAPFLLFAHGIYIWFVDRIAIRRWIYAMGIIALSFVPWMPVFLRQLHGGTDLTRSLPGWSTAVSTPPLISLPLILSKFTLGRITIDDKLIYALIVGLSGLFLTILIRKSWKDHKIRTLSLSVLITFPIFALVILSFVIPVIAPQRVLYVLPYVIILAAAGTKSSSLDNVWGKIALIVFASLNIFGLALYYTQPRYQREHWREATQYVERHISSDSDVFFLFPEPFAPFLWYRRDTRLGFGVVKNFTVSLQDREELKNRLQSKSQIFLFQYLGELTDPREAVPRIIVEEGFIRRQTTDFPGVGFIYEYDR